MKRALFVICLFSLILAGCPPQDREPKTANAAKTVKEQRSRK